MWRAEQERLLGNKEKGRNAKSVKYIENFLAVTITNTEGKAGDCVHLFDLGNNGLDGNADTSYGQWGSAKAIS